MADEKLQLAVETYLNRKSRVVHPEGKFDGKKRFYPTLDEKRTCCDSIRFPSAAYPFSWLVHCRTMIHVACLFDVEVKDLRRAVKLKSNQPLVGKTKQVSPLPLYIWLNS